MQHDQFSSQIATYYINYYENYYLITDSINAMSMFNAISNFVFT